MIAPTTGDASMTFREHAVLMGESRSLVGIHCVPASDDTANGATVIVLNSGIIHRVGANRLHVQLARALASLGIPALRFDFSGIGDSLPRTDSMPLEQAAMDDIRIAIDHATALRKNSSVVLVGLCSGATHALLYSVIDPRVEGVVLLDLMLPHTVGYWARHVMRRLTVLSTWRNVITGRTPLWRQASAAVGIGDAESTDQTYPSRQIREVLDTKFKTLVARKAQTLAVFTNGLEGQHNYRRQMLDAIPAVDFKDLLQLEYFADADHTFSNDASRGRLVDTITRWLTAEFLPRRQSLHPANRDEHSELVAAAPEREDIAF